MYGRNKAAIAVNLIEIAPAIVRLLQLFGGNHTGAEKKAAAIDAGKKLVVAAGETALASNPAFEQHYGDVIQGAFDMVSANDTLGSAADTTAASTSVASPTVLQPANGSSGGGTSIKLP